MSREIDRRNKSLRRFYSMGEIEAITSLSRATIYRKIAQGTFPASVQISKGRVGWETRAIDQWCEALSAPGRSPGCTQVVINREDGGPRVRPRTTAAASSE